MNPGGEKRWRGRSEDVFFSESIFGVSSDGYGWRIECVTFNDDGSFGPFNETAIGGTLTKWGARRKIKRWKKQFRREALAIPPRPRENTHG